MQQQGVRVILAQSGLKGSSSAQGPCPRYKQPRQRMGLALRKRCLVEPTKNFYGEYGDSPTQQLSACPRLSEELYSR